MKYFMLIVGLILTSSLAQAQETRSEFFYQANAGESFAQGNLRYSKITHDGATGGGEIDVTDLNLRLAYEMGFSEMIALYGNIGYGQGELDDAVDFKGLDPINLGAKLRLLAGPGQFFGRANLGLGLLGDLDCGSNNDCNRTDGSTSLALRLGYVMTYDTGFSGLSLDYGLFSTDGSTEDGRDIEKEGNIALTAFYEKVYAEMIFGGAIAYTMAGRFGDTSLQNGFNDDGDIDDVNYWAFKAYSRIPMTEGLMLLGSLKYDFMVDQNEDSFDGGSGIGLNLGLRMNL